MGATIATIEHTLWIVALVLAAVSGRARAHDPGLSTFALSLSEGDSRAQFELVVRDAELPVQRRASSRRCRASEVIAAHVAGAAVPTAIACRAHDPEHTSFVGRLNFEHGGELRIELPILDELPRGHQIYAHLKRATGEVVARRILDRGSDSVSVKVEAAPPSQRGPAVAFGVLGLALVSWFSRRWLRHVRLRA